MGKATCKTCGAESPNHVPSLFDGMGIGNAAHRIFPPAEQDNSSQSNSKSEDTSLDDTNKALERAFIDYRIKCDMALSERDDGVYTQAEYEEAIMWNLDNAISFVHEIYSSRIAKLLQVIEDEVIGEDVKYKTSSRDSDQFANSKRRSRNALKAEQRQALKQIKDNVINGGS